MSIPTNRSQLLKAWTAHLEHKRPHLAQTTYDIAYGKTTLCLQQMPYWITSGQNFLDWLNNEKNADGEPRWGHETKRRTLQKLKAATAWAAKTRLISRDPFANIDNFPQRLQTVDQYRAFTSAERRAILAAAQALAPHHRIWIQALFYTGCRPSELRALKRSHWSRDGRLLQIISAYPMKATAPKDTKTRKTTPDYPVNAQLRTLLQEVSTGKGPNDFLFLSPTGRPFHYTNFQQLVFKPLCERLADAGAIAFPLSQYHARHTWITEMLKTHAIADVAYLARTSPEIIMQHYAGRSRSYSIPEFS